MCMLLNMNLSSVRLFNIQFNSVFSILLIVLLKNVSLIQTGGAAKVWPLLGALNMEDLYCAIPTMTQDLAICKGSYRSLCLLLKIYNRFEKMWVLQAPYQGSIIEICLNWGYEYVSTFINVFSFKCKICNQLNINTILEEKNNNRGSGKLFLSFHH